MKRIKQFTSRILAVMLAGTLAVGSVSVSAFGAEDAGSTVAAAEEFSVEEATEESMAEASSAETVDEEVMTESSSAEVVDGEGVSESPDAAFADTSGIAAEEAAVASYTVTLDANGGYFVNEWDDVLNETLEKTEVLNKIVPVGGTVPTIPLNDQEGITATFLGWSLERDGEILPQEQEGYAPVGDCVLYAMWKYDDIVDEKSNDDSLNAAEENTFEAEPVQETASENVEDSSDEDTNEDTVEEYEQEENQETVEVWPAQEDAVTFEEEPAQNTDELAASESTERIIEDETVQEEDTEALGKNEETYNEAITAPGTAETVSTDAVMSQVASGTCGYSGDNLTWVLDDEGTLTISGTGQMKNYQRYMAGYAPWYSHKTQIVAIVISNGVTSIGVQAFSYCSSLTSVTIGNSVTSIGEEAFSYCSSLTSVTIPDSVTSIGEAAFYDCDHLTRVTIPDSVTSIGTNAFYQCSSLTSVTIGNSVTSIGEYAFYYCSSLTSVTIGNSVTSIGANAFLFCSSLTSVTIPDSVTSIGACAFYDCSSLTSVTIPDSVTSIGANAFQGCNSLTSVTIGNSVTSIGTNAFYQCSSLTSVTIGNSVTSIGDGAFQRCSNLTSVTIGDSVTSIGEEAFYDCSSLTSVTIPDSVTSIGANAFQGCNSLTSVTIPDSVTSIGDGAFYQCSSLTSVTIGNSVTSIGANAFQGCSSLTSVTIPDSVTSIGAYAFQDCSSLTSVTIGNSVTSIGDGAFYQCSSLTSVTIGNSVTSIGKYAFYECSSLTSVTIPDSVTSIGDRAFFECSSLTSVTIPDSVTSIGDRAFVYCPNLVVFTNNEYVIQYCKANNIKYCTCVTDFYPEIGATNVDHNSEHLFFIDFAYNFVPNGGYAYLYESGKTECVDKIHIYDPSTDANASEIGFRYGYGNTQNGLELNFSKNKLQKGKKYSIAIDSDAIRFVDDNGDEIGVKFPGLEKDVWTFTTVDLDYFSFPNPKEFSIPLRLYTKLFSAIESVRLRTFLNHGEDGLCFGLDYLVGLNKLGKGYILEYLVNASTNLSELEKSKLTDIKAKSLDYSLLEYLELAFIYQHTPEKEKEGKDNKDKYDRLYSAIKACKDSPITIGIETDEGGYHAIYPITILKESNEYCEVLVYDSERYTFTEGNHAGLETYLQKLKINKSDEKWTGVEYQNKSVKAVTYRRIDNSFDYSIGHVSLFTMVSSDGPLRPGTYAGLTSIVSTNGDGSAAKADRYLYWLEGNTFDVVLSEDNTLSITDGYDEIEVTASAGASVNLDIENVTAKVENTNASKSDYTITHTYAVDDDDFKSVVIKGETSSTVNMKKTEDGIIVTNEDGTPVEATVSLTENDEEVQTVDISADTDSINIKYNDNNTVTITEDTDSDGTYETVIAGEEAKKIADAVISGISNKTYTGSAITQSAVVTYEGKQLVEGKDFIVSYKNNTNAGTATVTITGKGNYTGTMTETFIISPAPITETNVTGLVAKTYTGKAITQTPVVKLDSSTLTQNTDYTVSFKNNVKAGTATVTITGKGNYTGTRTATFKINRATIAKAKVTCPASKVWAGWALTPVPTVKLGAKTLKKGTDFSLAFKNNKNVGTATITITGKGNYTGTIKKTFKINPKPTSISKLTGGSKNFTIGWKKQPSQTSGYQIQYSSRNDFKTQKIVTVSGASKTSRTVSGLAKKHKYYVRIRTYKTVGKTKYYSTWSAAKTVTTK